MSSMSTVVVGELDAPASVVGAHGPPTAAKRRTVTDSGANVNGVAADTPHVSAWVGGKSGLAWYGAVDVSQT